MGFFADVGPLTVFVSHQVSIVPATALAFLFVLLTVISLVRPCVANPSRHEIRPKFESAFLRVGRAGQYWSYARVSSLRRASRSSRRTQESA